MYRYHDGGILEYFTTCTHARILREAFPAGVARCTTVWETAIDIARVLQLGFAERGTATVLIESLELVEVDDRRELKAATYRYLQLGAYTSESAAGDLGHEIRHRWAYPVSVSVVDTDGRRLHRVRVGPFSTIQTLDQARDVLIEAGYPSPDSIP